MDLNLPTIAFFSQRVINKGEELTFNYNLKRDDLNVDRGSDDEDEEKENTHNDTSLGSECKCGSENCKKTYF